MTDNKTDKQQSITPPAAYTATTLSPLRKMIAVRMVEAKQTIPHYRVATVIRMDALIALRARLNQSKAWDNPEVDKLSINDLLLKALGHTLAAYPALNCQLVGDELRQFEQVDVAVITAIPGGVTTPVIRHLAAKTVVDIAAEVKSLVARAKAGQLKMPEITGGAVGLSNLGMYGIDQFDAIISPPQCAMLAVAAAKREVVVEDDAMVMATVMRATLSLDHRAIDGAQAAEFMQRLKNTVEQADVAVFNV